MVYGDLSPSLRTVARRIQHFTDGRESVEDEANTGSPRTSVTDSSVERAKVLIVEYPNITLRFLATEVHMLSSMSTLVGPRGVQDGPLIS